MIFADKLIALRKKSGWSQEELAEKLDVSRQAVSKWEGAQSVPDLDRIIKLSALFGVSTDYLLKDELEVEERVGDASEASRPDVRRVSMEEAVAFLSAKQQTVGRVALATLLCVLSPICLLVLSVLGDGAHAPISENLAGGIGMIALVALVAVAVVLFLSAGSKTRPYEYLDHEAIETEYGVSGLAKERREAFRPTYDQYNLLGTILCILAVLPIFAGAFFSGNGLLMVFMVCLTLVIAGIGVTFFVRAGIPWASYNKLLEDADYTPERKRNSRKLQAISAAYWMLVTAGYLAWCFLTDDWQNTWVVWPVAGVAFGALMALCGAFSVGRKGR